VFLHFITDDIFVVPPCLFYLEEEAVGGGEFFGWEVEDEAGVDVFECFVECLAGFCGAASA